MLRPEREQSFRQLPMYDKLIFKPIEPFSLLSSRALAIGDVDNDKDVELVLGTTNGDLFIIKHDQPWRSYSGLQIVSAVAIGDVYNQGKVSHLGHCYIFDVSPLPPLIPSVPSHSSQPVLSASQSFASLSGISGTSFTSTSYRRDTNPKSIPQTPSPAPSGSVASVNQLDTPVVEQIAPNAQVAVLFDYDADGKVELLIGRSDRAVDCYVMAIRDTPPPQPLARPSSAASATSPNAHGPDSASLATRYHLKRKASWTLAGEVASLVPVMDITGKRLLLVGQQAGSFAVISQDGIVSTPVAALAPSGPPSLLLPNGLDSSGQPTLLVATLNSAVKCLRHDGKLMFETQLDLPLCSFARVYPAGHAAHSVVAACSYDGMTFLLSKEKSVVQLPFGERVCAFTAGDLTVFPGQTLPCLVYVTVDGRIFIYYGIRHLVGALREGDLIDDLKEEFEELRQAMGVETEWTREEKATLLNTLWLNADKIPTRDKK